MSPDDLFIDEADHGAWGSPLGARRANTALLDGLRRGQVAGVTDVDAGLALAQQIQSDLMAYGTDGGEAFDNAEIGLAIRALRATLARLGVTFEVPFRDYTTFRAYWNTNGAYGSWQARREMVVEYTEPVLTRLFALQDRIDSASSIVEPALSALTDAASIRDNLRRLDSNVDAGDSSRHILSRRRIG